MEPITDLPVCAPAPSDTLPMLVVAGVFLLCWWWIRHWKKKRVSKKG